MMSRNFGLYFYKVSRTAASGGVRPRPGPIAIWGNDREPIKLSSVSPPPDAVRPNLSAFGRSPFIPYDAKPAFPPFNFLQTAIDVLAVAFGLLFLALLAAALPLAILIFMLAVA
jgi:hypothetical protein